MKITKEINDLSQFHAWSGGMTTLNTIKELGKIDELTALVEEMFPNGATETEINDFLWFETDVIERALGLPTDTL